MSWFTQSVFPGLYWAFQYWLGGTMDKRKLSWLHYRRHQRVLEVGCSVGNVAAAFRNHDCDYLGLDIDEAVVSYARRRFAHFPHMRFRCASLLDLRDSECFDYILFAGVCHHIAALPLETYLVKASNLLTPEGCLVVIDPVIPRGGTWLMRAYARMDKGDYMRTEDELLSLLGNIPTLASRETGLYPVGATPLSWPAVAQFIVVRMVLALDTEVRRM